MPIENRHIVIDEIIKRFPRRTVAIIDSITLIATLGITAIITWRLLISALFEYKYKTIISLTVQIPSYPFWWLFVLAWAVLFLVVISKVYESIKKAVKR